MTTLAGSGWVIGATSTSPPPKRRRDEDRPLPVLLELPERVDSTLPVPRVLRDAVFRPATTDGGVLAGASPQMSQ
jgi:hypothetical protein